MKKLQTIMTDRALGLECLRLAANTNLTSPETVINTAERYYEFIIKSESKSFMDKFDIDIMITPEMIEGRIESVGDRGVWVPPGLTGPMILAAAKILEDEYDVVPYTSRSMVRDIWPAMVSAYKQSDFDEI